MGDIVFSREASPQLAMQYVISPEIIHIQATLYGMEGCIYIFRNTQTHTHTHCNLKRRGHKFEREQEQDGEGYMGRLEGENDVTVFLISENKKLKIIFIE